MGQDHLPCLPVLSPGFAEQFFSGFAPQSHIGWNTDTLFSGHPESKTAQAEHSPGNSPLQCLLLLSEAAEVAQRWLRGGSRDSWSAEGTVMGSDPMTPEQSPCRD